VIKLNAFVYAVFFCLFADVVPTTIVFLTILKITLLGTENLHAVRALLSDPRMPRTKDG